MGKASLGLPSFSILNTIQFNILVSAIYRGPVARLLTTRATLAHQIIGQPIFYLI